MAELQKAGINLTIQGEAQYVAGLRNINREMDLMATNTKLAVAQLGQGASPTQKFNTQMRSLGAEIQKASTQTMILRNRNKELPNEIFKTGKSLDGLKDDYEKQVKVLESYRQKRDEVYKNNTFYSEDATKAREAFNEQQASVKELESEIKKLEGSYNGMLEEYERMPNSMAEAQLATQQLLNEQAKLREEYLKSGGVFTGFADKLESSGEKLQRYGRNISDIGDAFMGVTVGILAGGGGALKAFMDWEGALRGAMKTNSEIIDSNGNVTYSYQDLEDGLRGLSKEIPVANTELAEFAEIAGRLQVPTDEVVEFTEVVAKLGETTNLSGEEAAEQLGKFINITGASTSSTLNLANALVELGNNTAASEQETLRMSTRWASTGKIIGMTDDQILGLSASVISLGIRTEAGGSAVQRSFLKINDAVLEGGDTLASFAKTAGMSSEDFKKAWQDDAAQALIPFLKGLNDTHEAGGNVNGILKDLGITSVNELNTLLVLAGGYDQLAGNLELASDAYNETEESMMALNKEAELAYGTTLGKLRTAWNRLKDSLIDIGEPIADAVLDMVDAAEPLFKTVEDLATGFSNLDETAQRDIISTVAKIALIAPALKIAGGMMTTTGDIFKVGAGVTRKAGEIITKAMFGAAGEVETLTTVAGTATGSKGVGGLVGVLSGAGAGALPWALGIAAVALGGWTLWKTWGEEALEAGKRTRKWGTAVDESVDDVLTSIQKTDGKFGLMANGVDVGAESMVESFRKVGSSIETDLINRLAITEEYLAGLPEVLRASQAEIFEESMTQQQEAITLIEKNNAEILAIEEKALAERGKLNEVETAAINMIHQDSVDAYITALQLGADEERSIRSALSGDVKEMGREVAQDLLVNLGEANRQLDDEMRSTLSDLKISHEEGAISAKEYETAVADVERYYEALGVTGKRTMRDIVGEYDDLIYSVNLATGEIISAHARTAMGEEHYQEIVRNNIAIVEQYGEAQKKSASEAADAVDWLVDRGRGGAKTWNSIVIDSGGNMDVFKEKVMETAKTAEGWNHIRFQIHEANLDSNAKLIIGEAAIANGYWDSMTYKDKQAILKDNFSETVYRAIRDEGTWDKLKWEEQVALLNNEFSDGVIQAIIDEGKWKDLPWEQKHAVLTTNSPETLKQVLEDIGVWETLPIPVRNLLADKTQLDKTVENAQKKLNSLRDKSVTITTRNQTIYESIYRAQGNKASSNWVQSGGRILHNARGTDFHPGGMAMVNDQQGASFRELVTLPDGSSFIPKGRNVMLDLPKGSRVLRAALTKMKFPDIKQYKDGVGYSRQQTQQIMANNNTDMSQTNNLLTTLIDMVRNGQVIQMDGNEVGRTVYSTIDGTMTRNIQRNQIMNMQGG